MEKVRKVALGKISKSEMLKRVAEKLGQRVNDYLEKKERYALELEHDLEQLYSSYGVDIVKWILEKGGMASRKPYSSRTPDAPENEIPAKRGRGRPRKVDSQPKGAGTAAGKKGKGLGIAALTPIVTEIIDKDFKGKSFMCAEVAEVLTRIGLKFDTSHLSFILRRMDSLEIAERRKAERGGGPTRIVYRAKAA